MNAGGGPGTHAGDDPSLDPGSPGATQPTVLRAPGPLCKAVVRVARVKVLEPEISAALPLSDGKRLDLSVPQFPPLQSGENPPTSTRVCQSSVR